VTSAQIVILLGPRTCFPDDLLTAVRRRGHVVTVLSPDPVPAVDRVERIRLDQHDGAVALTIRLHEELPVAGVIGLEEATALLAARIAAELGLPAHPVDAAEAALDKPTMKRRLAAAGVPIADYVLATGEDDAVRWAAATGYPVVVKPCRGSASQGVMRADDESELRQAYRRLRRIVRDYGLDTGGRAEAEQLVERYLDGQEVAVELVVQDGRAFVATVFEKPHPLVGPFFEETVYLTPPRLDEQLHREVEELAVRAAGALGLRNGPAHCEIRLTSDGPVVLEIAARLVGGPCAKVFHDRLDGDIDETLLRLATGEPIDPPAIAPDAPVVAAMMLPVPADGRVVAVRGADRAAGVPGIRTVTVPAPGDLVVPFPEAMCYSAGYLTAAGPTHTAVEEALAAAASSIELDLAPIACEWWSRPITEADAEYRPPAGFTVTAGADRDTVASALADIVMPELPRQEALTAARQRIETEAAAGIGEPSWLVVGGKAQAVLLSFADGDTGTMCCIGVRHEDRRTGVGEIACLAQYAEFARRGCTTAMAELDPRLPVAQALARRIGLAPDPACTRGTGSACCDA